MKKVKSFETIYRFSRQYALGKMAGPRIEEQKSVDQNSEKFRKLVYLTFRQEVQNALGLQEDRNAWVFEQNELKTKYDGKESLKSLCGTFYLNNCAANA